MRTVIQWFRAAFQREALDRSMKVEMQQHIDEATRRLMARGLAHEDAVAAARREFGNVAVLEEEGRDARGAAWVESVRSDVRYAWRAMRATPAFSIVAVLSLAIGIGANTAVFSLVDAVLLKPLPVASPSQLVQIRRGGGGYLTNPQWEQLRDHTPGISGFAVIGTETFNLALSGEEQPALGAWVNGDFFSTLGLMPAAGRLISRSDDQRGCSGAAVVSYGYWRSNLGGRDNAVGSTITLSGHPFQVIGVAPEGFVGVDVGRSNQIYLPLCAEAVLRGDRSALDQRTTWWLRALGRALPNQSVARTSAMIATVSRAVNEATAPRFNVDEYVAQDFSAEPGATGFSSVRKDYSSALLALMGMVAVILLISCANVANLMLARGAARNREMAVRVALGASRWRLTRQMLTESALIAVLGAGVGVVIARWGGQALVGMLGTAGGGVRISLDLSLDLRVLGFTTAASIVTILLCGMMPAWRSTRVDPQSAMKAGGRAIADGQSRFTLGKALVIAQCSLALMLVVGAGLLVGTFRRLETLDPGFRAEGVLTVSVETHLDDPTPQRNLAAQQRVLSGIRGLPGVGAASLSLLTPISGSAWNDFIVVEGSTPASKDDSLAWFNAVSDDYFRVMDTRIIEGRALNANDRLGSQPVAVISRAVAARFHGKSPIGRYYQTFDHQTRGRPVYIVGVVDDAKYRSLREAAQPVVYVAAAQDSMTGPYAIFQLRANGGASALALIDGVKRVAAEVDPKMSLKFTALSDQVAESLGRERALAMLSGFFGALALGLAMIGLYGVMAYTVARRRVEIGIRIALGAARSRVIRLVLGDVGRMIGIGIVVGGIGALAATRYLAAFLFGVTADDPMTLLLAAALLAMVAAVAGAIPASRAARLEPVDALRED